MSIQTPKVDTSTQASTDKTADREPQNANTNAQAAAQAASVNPLENATQVIPDALLADGSLNPLFVVHCQISNPKALGPKGLKECQNAMHGHKGKLPDVDFSIVEKVFALLSDFSKAESIGHVRAANTAEVRKHLRIYNEKTRTAEKVVDIRCLEEIPFE